MHRLKSNFWNRLFLYRRCCLITGNVWRCLHAELLLERRKPSVTARLHDVFPHLTGWLGLFVTSSLWLHAWFWCDTRLFSKLKGPLSCRISLCFYKQRRSRKQNSRKFEPNRASSRQAQKLIWILLRTKQLNSALAKNVGFGSLVDANGPEEVMRWFPYMHLFVGEFIYCLLLLALSIIMGLSGNVACCYNSSGGMCRNTPCTHLV